VFQGESSSAASSSLVELSRKNYSQAHVAEGFDPI
jgi:hypothetical protein